MFYLLGYLAVNGCVEDFSSFFVLFLSAVTAFDFYSFGKEVATS